MCVSAARTSALLLNTRRLACYFFCKTWKWKRTVFTKLRRGLSPKKHEAQNFQKQGRKWKLNSCCARSFSFWQRTRDTHSAMDGLKCRTGPHLLASHWQLAHRKKSARHWGVRSGGGGPNRIIRQRTTTFGQFVLCGGSGGIDAVVLNLKILFN